MSQKEAFEAWWRAQRLRPDPAGRDALAELAFNAGYVKGMLPQMDRIAVLEDALKAALKLPRPWMDGGVTFEEWAASFDKIAAALARERA